MNNNMLLIINPKAGKGKINKKIPNIIRNFEQQGYRVKQEYTQRGIKTGEIVSRYKDKTKLIVCCGGDGTLNRIINEIMNWDNKPQIGFIPLGTMNDFAKTMKISTRKTSLSKNINETVGIYSDIGNFNEKYFNYVAAFGAFTSVSYITSQKLKKKYGKIAYILVGMRVLKKIKSYQIQIEFDGKIVDDEFIYGSISNSKSVGGFELFKNNDVKIDDGKYEMLFVKKPKNKIGWINILFSLLFKKYNSKNFIYQQIGKINIKSEKNIPWTLDGEYGGRTKEVKITNNQKSIEYIVSIN